jgi:Outer membrane protein beta-barrel domain
MKKLGFTTIFSLAGLLLLSPAMHAQAIYAAKQNFRIQAGAAFLHLNNDYSPKPGEGLTAWVDVDLKRFHGVLVGAEVEANFGGIITPDDFGENTYLVGPRFSYQIHKLNLYGKVLVGRGTLTNQIRDISSTYNVLPAFGGGVEYRITRKINLRPVNFEYQQWPSFSPNGLTPLAISFGASYIIR